MFIGNLLDLPLFHRRGGQLDALLLSPQLPAREEIGVRLDPPPVALSKGFRTLIPPPSHPLKVSFQRNAGVRLGHNSSPVLGDHQRVLSEASHFSIRSLLLCHCSGITRFLNAAPREDCAHFIKAQEGIEVPLPAWDGPDF